MRCNLSSFSAVCAAVVCVASAGAFANGNPPEVKRIGLRVTIDDGSGGVRTYRLSEEERAQARLRPWRDRFMEETGEGGGPAQPAIAAPLLVAPRPRPKPEQAPTPPPAASTNNTAAPKSPSPPAAATPPPAARGADGNSVILPPPVDARLPDGRKLPFGIPISLHKNRVGKTVDESVDPYGALRNYGEINKGFSTGRYESSSWKGGSRSKLEDQETPALISSREWQSRFSPWVGRRDLDIETRDLFQGDRREMPLREQKHKETSISPWSGERASETLRNGTTLVIRDHNQRFLTNEIREMKHATNAYAREEISMQSLNRYQFRRTHPVEPGLPGISPGGALQPNRFKSSK
ncbi:MAG: hypothetical protein LBS59_03085 [Puniceicoccales bacterium]|jgi:hypothetical protein|nr:hypothetical protein [Puniceicoccales bacterium]